VNGKMVENRTRLTNKRILYCIRPNMDNSLIKFGVGGVEHGETSAFGRLLQYVNYYGESGEFDCQGVKLFLIAANEYNPNVDGKNSAIFRKEKFLKAQLKGDTLSGRGTERVTTNIDKLFKLIKQTSNKTDAKQGHGYDAVYHGMVSSDHNHRVCEGFKGQNKEGRERQQDKNHPRGLHHPRVLQEPDKL